MQNIPEIEEELALFRRSVAHFVDTEVAPHRERFRKQQRVDRDLWLKAGEAGLLLTGIAAPWGAGGDFRHEAVVIEELCRIGFVDFGIPMHGAIVAPYIWHYGTQEQHARWLPGMASGERVGALAMTEPGTGSDLRAIRTSAKLDGDHWVINGAKTFITNGILANMIVVACRSDPAEGGKGLSMIVVDTDGLEGFRRGRNLEKIGFKGSDTAELFFDECRVPVSNLIGERGRGFMQMTQQLPQERLIIALQAVASMEAAVDLTIAYTKERHAFGQPISEFQNTRFKLAECKTEAVAARAFVDKCIADHVAGKLDATMGAMIKWWATQKQCEVIDECLQLFGGYGYMAEYPISHMWTDARLQKIYGGTNEIMKELVARSL
jgi:acyl-CoA dehydrogenase